jgi:hypothetical protein
MEKRLVLAAFFLAAAALSPALPARVETMPAAGSYLVTSDRVNVRASPDLEEGRVVGKLNKGNRVEVSEMTLLAYDVQGMRAAWFRVKEPEGWVFGYYLDPAP